VSPTYAREILTAEHGMGLDGLLSERRDRPSGILNGVDYELWNPATDDLIPARYSAADLSGKATCRDGLLDELDLDPAPDGPLLGIVSRLAGQKGFELVGEVLPEVLTREDVRLVVLGTGEDEYEALFERLAEDFPGKVAFRRMFDAALAHRIEAGSDVFLMPSRFEPCGLNQMYSLKYGTPPIVHRIGGLADTVEPFDSESGKGTGFAFEPFGADGFQLALESALEVYRQPDRWHRLMLNGMALDFSWARQVEAYVATYQSVLVDTASVVVSVDGSG
jgi:starch synthase